MSSKQNRSQEFKRAIDLGQVELASPIDLVKIWRIATGDEKAITLQGFVATVDRDIVGIPDGNIRDIIDRIDDIEDDLYDDPKFVPYVGAVENVILGDFGLSTNHIIYDTTPVNLPTAQGSTYWDVDDNTIAVILNGYTMKVGEDVFFAVKNQTGSTITKGTACGFAGTVGSSGRLLTKPYLANGSESSTFFMGVAAENIADGADGKVLWFGRIRGLNTNAFDEGDILYVSTSSAGGFQTTVPQAPNNIIQVAAVITKSSTVGTIFVRPTIGSNINKDEGVKIDTPLNNDVLKYNSTSGLWENAPDTGGVVQPNGLVVIGTVDQTGNDIDVNPDWVWRFNQVIYQKTTITPFTITPTATDFTRIDLVSGNTSGNVIITTGTAVEDPAVAVAPNLPANNVGFFLVFVSDTGITALQNFALSSFVRFDIDNQNLSEVQRQNARTNIQALSRDTNDSRTGTLTQNGDFIINYGTGGNVGSLASFTTPGGRSVLSLRRTGSGTVFSVIGNTTTGYIGYDKGSSVYYGIHLDTNDRIHLGLLSNGNSQTAIATGFLIRSVQAHFFSSKASFLGINQRSLTVTDTGTINDYDLGNNGRLIFTLADDLTGIIGEDGRNLLIENRNPTGLIIRHDSASSTAANRFSLPDGLDFVIENGRVYTFIYTNGRWRLLDADKYPEAVERENNTVLFDKNYIIGNAGARTGNILFDFTGAKLGAWTEMKHLDAGMFTFPAEAVLMFDSDDISTTDDNYFLFVLTKKSSTEIVKVFHAIEGGV
jgi:hypothetical protein